MSKAERKLNLITGCKTYGTRRMTQDSWDDMCNDKECGSCRYWQNSFERMLQKEIDKLKKDSGTK